MNNSAKENTAEKEVLVEVKELSQTFPLSRHQVLTAVDKVSFSIKKGETLGLVGESGCGKTTTGRSILRLYEPSGGEVYFKGKPVSQISGKDMKEFRKSAQMIFQDPYSSLDPRMTVDEIIGEGLDVHFPNMTSQEKHDRISRLLMRVGLNSEHGARFPHELSGGQRQRIGVARALAVEPDFIICDEPISALDVSIQAQVVNLLIELQKEDNLTYLFISHDLSMVKHISDNIGVMYLGSLVEVADNNRIYEHPLHPYTYALISAIPVPDPDVKSMEARVELKGEVPSPINVKPSCKFASRCPYAFERCKNSTPKLNEVMPEHFVACYLYENEDGSVKENVEEIYKQLHRDRETN